MATRGSTVVEQLNQDLNFKSSNPANSSTKRSPKNKVFLRMRPSEVAQWLNNLFRILSSRVKIQPLLAPGESRKTKSCRIMATRGSTVVEQLNQDLNFKGSNPANSGTKRSPKNKVFLKNGTSRGSTVVVQWNKDLKFKGLNPSTTGTKRIYQK
jgi:hypothetical protein